MKLLNLMTVLVLLWTGRVQAETITCEMIGKGEIKEVIAIRNNHDYEPQWFDVVVKKKGFFSKDQNFSLSPLYFSGDKMKLMEFEGSPSKAKMLMSFERVSTLSSKSSKVEVILNKGGRDEILQLMSCRADRPVKFVDYCSTSNSNKNPAEVLLHASRMRNSNLVEMLISCDPNVNIQDSRGCTPLMYTVDHKCGTGKADQFRDFAHNGRIVDALISAGAFVDIADPVTLETPLIKSATDRNHHVVKALADMEADVNAQDREGSTALMNAVRKNDVKLVELILSYNPDLELANNSGQTAAMIASTNGFTNIELLLQTPDKILTFSGNETGGCSLNDNNIELNKVVLIKLNATEKKMFLLEIPELGINLMANPGETKSVRLRPSKVGSYKYICGLHGGNSSSKGSMTVH